ncbi:MAG: cytochrome c biogenesis protein ResB [Nitrospirae bacterium]|nr:cytochrome c biogenesis protein ResB [Nitrospirota bacterium]
MVKFKRFFLSRKTVLTLLTLILTSVFISALFPQRFVTSPENIQKWQQAHPFLAGWYKTPGFDHVYTTIWFALLLSLFLIPLLLSTIDQFIIAKKRTLDINLPAGSSSKRTTASFMDIKSICRGSGYLLMSGNEDYARFVKHQWGYWGNFLLHLGFVVVVSVSLLIALTQKRGVLQMAEGEIFQPGDPWFYEYKGLLAGKFVLPFGVRLDSVRALFWENNKVRRINSNLNLFTAHDSGRNFTVAPSSKLNYKGILIYHSLDFGHAFFVEFNDSSGTNKGVRLDLYHPENLDVASYKDFKLSWMPYILKVKYYADAGKKVIDSPNPLLVLRLMDRNKVAGQIPLKIGESGTLGQYNVRLVGAAKWSGLIFVDITGMPGIFFGFLIIILGTTLNYFTPPRELFVKRTDNEYIVYWRAVKFSGFYTDEYGKIISRLKKKENS